MSHRYSTAFSHLLLAGTGLYCLARYHGGGEGGTLKLPCGTYIIIISNSILGAIYWGNEHLGEHFSGIYHSTTFAQNIIALPFVVSQMLLDQNYHMAIAFTPVMACAIPVILKMSNNASADVIDTLIAINAIGLAVVSVLSENFWGVATAGSYAFSHFCIRAGSIDFENVPALDLFNYSLIFFCLFTLKTV